MLLLVLECSLCVLEFLFFSNCLNFLMLLIFRRYNDKSSAKHNLDQFLVDAHKTQIKELNGTTGGFVFQDFCFCKYFCIP